MKFKYILSDTSVFIDCFKREKNSDSPETLIKLLELLNKKKVILLLPEVIQVETLRNVNKSGEEFLNNSGEILESLNIRSDYHKAEFGEKIEEFKKEKKKEFLDVSRIMDQIFKNKNTELIEVDFDIFYSAYKRGIEGKKPFKLIRMKDPTSSVVHDIQPDCLIIESARQFLAKEKDYELFFCTTNLSDFCDLKGEKNILHPDIKEDFKNIEFFDSLSELLNAKFATTFPIKEKPKKINKEKSQEEDRGNLPKSVKVSDLIKELEYSASFDGAESNIKNILSVKSSLKKEDIEAILKAVLSNPNNYSINQVLAVEPRYDFLKKLYTISSDEKSIWTKFAESLVLYWENKPNYLKDYNWLFDRLGMEHIYISEDIPF